MCTGGFPGATPHGDAKGSWRAVPERELTACVTKALAQNMFFGILHSDTGRPRATDNNDSLQMTRDTSFAIKALALRVCAPLRDTRSGAGPEGATPAVFRPPVRRIRGRHALPPFNSDQIKD